MHLRGSQINCRAACDAVIVNDFIILQRFHVVNEALTVMWISPNAHYASFD
jgi:hypothetical protein